MELLRTGEVARLLGVSRQHVVDLCERGVLGHVRAGSHRRVPRSEVDRLQQLALTREQEKSLWLHRAVLAPLLSDPEAVLHRARDNIARARRAHRDDGVTAAYLDEWESVLDRGVDAVADLLSDRSERACELRQNSPFAGVLEQDVRLAVLHSFLATRGSEPRHVARA